MAGLRSSGSALLSSSPVRYLALTAIRGSRLAARVFSKARTAALFPHAPTLVCHHSVEVKYPERVTLGAFVVIGPGCTIGAAAPITLGDHVRLSRAVIVETAGLDFSGAPPYPHRAAPIVLEDGVWVGARAMILGGVTVGRGSVIGAGVVVSRDVPPGSVVVGNPPRIRGRGGETAS